MFRMGIKISALACAFGLAGCGSGRVDVAGEVSMNGKPVVYGSVTLVAADGIGYAGEIQPDGTFQVTGVPAGPVKIGVSSPNPRGIAQAAAGGRKDKTELNFAGNRRRETNPTVPATAVLPPEIVAKWFQIPERYEDPAKSGAAGQAKRGQKIEIVIVQ